MWSYPLGNKQGEKISSMLADCERQKIAAFRKNLCQDKGT